MPEYSTYRRFSQIDYEFEERKQQAHLKKISDMQRQNGLNNTEPLRFPHIHQGFLRQLHERSQEIHKQNETKLKKLVEIMTSKSKQPLSQLPPISPTHRHRPLHTPENNTEYLERVAKVKSKYDVHEWKKDYDRHQDYLRMRKNTKVFTPLGVGINRNRSLIKGSKSNSKRTTPTSSRINISNSME